MVKSWPWTYSAAPFGNVDSKQPTEEVIELLRKEGRALVFKEVADLLKDKSVDQSTIFRALKDLTKAELLVSH